MNKMKRIRIGLSTVKEQQNSKLITTESTNAVKHKIRSKSSPAILFPNKNANGATKNVNNQVLFNAKKNSKINATKNTTKLHGRKNTFTNKKNIILSNINYKAISKRYFRSWSSSPHKLRCTKQKLPIVLDFKKTENQLIKIEVSNTKHTVKFAQVPFQQEKSATEMSMSSSAKSKASYVAFGNMNIHEHNHKQQPHLHNFKCDRFASGLDKNRDSRFYFTKQKTPVRVYLNYNEKLAENQSNENKEEREKATLNGRKLSPRTLKNQLKISPHFIEEAKNYIFVKETLSLIPQLLPLPPLNNSSTNSINNYTFQNLTLAEMAVIPFNNLAPSVSTNSSKHKIHSNQSKKSKFITTSLSPNSISPK